MSAAESEDRADGPGLAELFAAHRVRLARLALLLVDDRASAEDVVQDAFAGLHARWRLRGRPEDPLAYLQRAVVNNARSVLRRRRTRRRYAPPYLPPAEAAEDVALLADDHRAVLAALSRVPTRQREVLVLRYWTGQSEQQIADTLGISRGTVKSSASRGLAALTTILEQQS